MKQSSFNWAKEFLQSAGWATVANSFAASGNSFSFTLTCAKPSMIITDITCPVLENALNVISDIISTDFEDDLDAGSFDLNLPDPSSLVLTMEQPMPLLQTPSPSLTAGKLVPRAKRGKSLHLSEANL